jgi:hypothetical protein
MSHHGARLNGLEPLPARPSTASIRIRTTPHNANPTPVASASGDGDDDDVADGFDFVRDEFTAERLRAISGEANLEDVRNLEIEVDTSQQSIAHLGELVPNLETLKLTNSRVDSFRDLGTRMRSLRIIWVTRCGITELDGIVALSALKELYIAFNDVSDLSPLALHEQCVVRQFVPVVHQFRCAATTIRWRGRKRPSAACVPDVRVCHAACTRCFALLRRIQFSACSRS